MQFFSVIRAHGLEWSKNARKNVQEGRERDGENENQSNVVEGGRVSKGGRRKESSETALDMESKEGGWKERG